jgi:glycosyltransferase involved in cell wall biosynthesis
MVVKVLYDHQIFSLQKWGGISRYYLELLNRYHMDPDLEIHLAIGESKNQEVKGTEVFIRDALIPNGLRKTMMAVTSRVTGWDLIYKTNMNIGRKFLDQQNFDIFHPTYYDPYFLEHLGRKPFYLEVHDMIHEVYPEFFSLSSRIPEWKREILDRADIITTVSESTKKDLMLFYNVEPSRIQVIHQGCSLDPTKSSPSDFPLKSPSNYVLYVGSRTLYKNFYLFAEAMAKLMKIDKELIIVCAGAQPLTEEELRFLARLGIKDRVHHVIVNDSTLCQLYSHAKAFVFPSLYEGFGLPVLEAFTCGCPEVLSNVSSLPEIGGDAAIYFEPKDITSMSDAISKVIYDEKVRAKLIEKGRHRIEGFSWDITAKKTKATYLRMV